VSYFEGKMTKRREALCDKTEKSNNKPIFDESVIGVVQGKKSIVEGEIPA